MAKKAMPLGVKLLTALYIISLFFMLYSFSAIIFAGQTIVFFFGLLVDNFYLAVLYNLAMFAVMIAVVYGLLKRQTYTPDLLIALNAFGIAHMLIMLGMLAFVPESFLALYRNTPEVMMLDPVYLLAFIRVLMTFTALISFVLGAMIIWYCWHLKKRRIYFWDKKK